MDKETAVKIIQMGKQDSSFKVGNIEIQFSRVSEEDISRIENMADKVLISEYKNLSECIEYSFFSIADLQMQMLMEMEIDSRGLIKKLSKRVRDD